MFRVRVAKNRVTLTSEISARVPDLICQDEAKVRQVLINLLGNAVKFTHEGQIVLKISISAGNTSKEAGPFTLVCDIQDSGIGIGESDQAHIFEAFEQAEAGRSTGGGTGLGLAISRQYAQLMDGSLCLIQSRPGKGALFRFSFTARPGDAADLNSSRILIPVEKLAPGQPETRILVVDDRYLNRDVMSQMLSRVGFVVQTAKNGRLAIGQFVRFQPDCILMDSRMPVMDGHTAIKEVRTLDGGPQVPIIAVSASTMDEQRFRAMESGANAFLKKPVQEEVLFDLLRQLLGLVFIYTQQPKTGDASDPDPLFKADIHKLPPWLTQKVCQACVIGNMRQLRAFTKKIYQFDQRLARAYEAHLNQYDIKTIQQVFSA